MGTILPPLLKTQILEAMRNSNSNSGAARYLGVNYDRYRKYALVYGLWHQHLNERGVGTPKGFAKLATTVKLRDIFAGKHLNYPLNKLKYRMIKRGLLIEQCTLCGFNERRITDNKLPLILTFKDGNRENMAQDNIHLLCYNCMFLTTGLPSLAHRRQLESAMKHPHRTEYPLTWNEANKQDIIVRPLPEDEDMDDETFDAGTLDKNTIDTIQQEIQKELALKEEEEEI